MALATCARCALRPCRGLPGVRRVDRTFGVPTVATTRRHASRATGRVARCIHRAARRRDAHLGCAGPSRRAVARPVPAATSAGWRKAPARHRRRPRLHRSGRTGVGDRPAHELGPAGASRRRASGAGPASGARREPRGRAGLGARLHVGGRRRRADGPHASAPAVRVHIGDAGDHGCGRGGPPHQPGARRRWRAIRGRGPGRADPGSPTGSRPSVAGGRDVEPVRRRAIGRRARGPAARRGRRDRCGHDRSARHPR